MSENTNDNVQGKRQLKQPGKALYSPTKKGPIGRALAPV